MEGSGEPCGTLPSGHSMAAVLLTLELWLLALLLHKGFGVVMEWGVTCEVLSLSKYFWQLIDAGGWRGIFFSGVAIGKLTMFL